MISFRITKLEIIHTNYYLWQMIRAGEVIGEGTEIHATIDDAKHEVEEIQCAFIVKEIEVPEGI